MRRRVETETVTAFEPPVLTPGERADLLAIARRSLEVHLSGRPCGAPWSERSTLLAPGAAFVTLRRRDDGELRGCCGETEARRPLADSVAAMAVAAAERDPRFRPVDGDELADIAIEISALGPLRAIEARAVEVGRHGLWISLHGRQGLLLPQVAVELGWDRDRLLAGLCEKARLEAQAWRAPQVELRAFEATCWGEA